MPTPRPTPKPTPVTFEEPLPWFALELALALGVAGGIAVVDGAVVMEELGAIEVMLLEELGAVVLALLEEDVEPGEIAASVMLK